MVRVGGVSGTVRVGGVREMMRVGFTVGSSVLNKMVQSKENPILISYFFQ